MRAGYTNYTDYKKSNYNLFINHEVTEFHTIGDNEFSLVWRDPETSIGQINITYTNGYLQITGDYGCATFTWLNPKLTLKWFSELDSFGYIMEKCRATSEDYIWDEDIAIAKISEHFDEYKTDEEADPDDCDNCNYTSAGYHMIKYGNWKRHTQTARMWDMFLSEHGDDLFNDVDYWRDAGSLLNPRVYIWWHALKEIVEFLEKQ